MSATSPRRTGRQGGLSVTVDATPLLGVRTGIGRFVEHLVQGLATAPEVDLSATAFTLRGWRSLAAALPPGVRHRGLPVPARLLRQAWLTTSFPPAEWIAGRSAVFHATNYVLPPLRRAAGVLSVHDLSYLHLPETVHQSSLAYRELVPRGLKRAAVACSLTAWTADELAEAYGFPRERIVVTPLGVDQPWFDAAPPSAAVRARWGLPADYLLFVGTKEPRKGLTTLVEAHRRLTAEAGSAVPPLVLVGAEGWGDQQPIPPESAPGSAVITLPYVDQADLPSLVAGATTLVMPSIYEGFGLPVLEAMAAGTSVVISRTPAMLEVAGGHAATFPVGDVDALAGVLARSLAGDRPDPLAAREFARGWSWQKCTDAALSAYRMAVS
ncbi:glycosyltransferase family 4 protein [Nakamurella lactea]|uniref:glycosyltransferase family 4 protein n=1 Tax=Nakamurella lactea TaxID=459515 RepID=UPI0004080E01|nr:glycosyltransferase family 1 protein [Nakamurella lactea]